MALQVPIKVDGDKVTVLFEDVSEPLTGVRKVEWSWQDFLIFAKHVNGATLAVLEHIRREAPDPAQIKMFPDDKS